MRRLVVCLLVLATGCSLPLSKDVKGVGEVQADVQQPAGVRVFPPLPQQGDTPTKVVEGFLRAQANSDDDHAIARLFLTNEASRGWDDTAEVHVYTAESRETEPEVGAGTATVTVRSQVVGDVSPDGRYVSAGRRVVERYSLARTSAGWRLTDVPDGLRLTAPDLFRAYQPHDVYYVAALPGASEQPHVVPDRVYLPIVGDLATSLVQRALRPPSTALSGSVGTGLPQGATLELRALRREPGGVISVDLSGDVSAMKTPQWEQLSARLVWTLRGDATFSGLRLLADGARVAVPGQGAVQDESAWDTYDPEGLGLEPAYFWVSKNRRLLSSLPTLRASPLTTPEAKDGIGVDAVAVSPGRSGTQVAVLDRTVVHVGALASAQFPPVASAAGLSSMTWGSGALGLWMLQRGTGVVRVDLARPQDLQRVSVIGELPGPPAALSLSRDGARAAVVAAGRLFVLRVEVVDGTPRLVDPTEVLRGLSGATDVTWATPTELVTIARLAPGPAVVLRLPVDGSSSSSVQAGALAPVSVAAAGRTVLIESAGDIYSVGPPVTKLPNGGHSPVFPG